LITSVHIGFITTTTIVLFYDILDINLMNQVSDKRLLERCGDGKGYLIEAISVSVRPPGLRIRRAGAGT
jgi:hypothetical protein